MIILQSIGVVDRGSITFFEGELRSIFDTVKVRPAAKVPASAHVPERDQLDGATILQSLPAPEPGAGDALLGVIDEDLFVADLNFVFGLVYGSRAIISLARLRQEFYSLSPNQDLFRERALKEAVHELGHVFGLPHCSDRRCVMHFSNSISDTDFKGWMYCERCREMLEDSGVKASF
ncbi:MAG TPA: archaemetzincin family Zn-dependent metalloprotease [Methanotrichaceae archaeon]|nr:archaemetzincin family Zn-dependent metalloprotease [Methanotrichaceae archaeon]